MQQQVLESLPTVQKGASGAELRDAAGATLYRFLYNPESLDYSQKLHHGETSRHLSPLPILQFQRAGAVILQLKDLILDGYSSGRSIRPLIDGISELARAATPVYFVWGSERFGPALISGDLSWSITHNLSGEPAAGRLSFNLSKVDEQKPPEPAKETPTEAADEAGKENTVNQAAARLGGFSEPTEVIPGDAVNLTQRQQAEGRTKASRYLRANLDKIPTDLRTAFRSEGSSINVTTAGAVTLVDPAGKSFPVGSYDGRTLNVSSGARL